jgi:hypothetical protein
MVDAGALKWSAVPVKQIFLNGHAVDRKFVEMIGNTSWGISAMYSMCCNVKKFTMRDK